MRGWGRAEVDVVANANQPSCASHLTRKTRRASASRQYCRAEMLMHGGWLRRCE